MPFLQPPGRVSKPSEAGSAYELCDNNHAHSSAVLMRGGELMMSGGTERIVRAAIRNWGATLRLCVLVVVVAAATGIPLYLVDPASLLIFMK